MNRRTCYILNIGGAKLYCKAKTIGNSILQRQNLLPVGFWKQTLPTHL